MVLRKSFYIHWSVGRSPRVHKVNPGRDPSNSYKMNKQVSAKRIYITYTNMTIYHLFYDFYQKPLCISFNYFNHHGRFKTNANVKLTKSSQPLRYGIYCIARRALKLITEQLQYGIYCIAIVVLKLWATMSGIYCIAM